MTVAYVNQLVEEGHFAEIDAIFAKWLIAKVPEAKEEQAAFVAALFWSSRQGHLCLSIDESLFSHIGEGRRELLEHLKRGSQMASLDPFVKREGALFYLQKNWMYETHFLSHFKRLIAQSFQEIHLEREAGLTDEQHACIEGVLSHFFSVICGGPGTGKTHTAKKIVEAFLKRDPEARILLAAPTGKAAKQLKQSMPERVQVTTLHALLGIHKEALFTEDPSPLMADLLIVDECSMVDARLFAHLFASIREDTHLVLIGDPEQLPAVENGSLFADLVDLLKSRFPKHLFQLTKCLRSDRQEILQFMHEVLRGELMQKRETEALSFVDWDLTQRKTYEKIQQLVESYAPLPSCSEPDPEVLISQLSRFALLSCLRKGAFGVDALNEMLARHFLEKRKGDELLAMPILITRSDAELDLSNGETGFLIRHARTEQDYAIFSKGALTKIAASRLPSYEYAYCLSVHKSQGSEYDDVILLVPPGSDQLGREVIYTGASRAKKRLRIAADEIVFKKALLRPSRKISGLHARLTV